MSHAKFLCSVSTHYQPCSSCVHFSLCFGVLSHMCVYLWSRPANGFYFINSVCFPAEIKYLTLRLWHTLVFALVSTAEQCCDRCVNVCTIVYALLNMTWFLSVLSVLIDSSLCMHSCDVSPCVGSRGAWSEVHVGQYGSAVVMTIILLINVLHKKVIGCTRGCSFQQSLVFCFAWQGNCYSRA